MKKHHAQLVTDFADWLEAFKLSPQQIVKHAGNISRFAESQAIYEPLKTLDKSDADDVLNFLINWYPHHSLDISQSTMVVLIDSFRKFFRFMADGGYIDTEVMKEVSSALLENEQGIINIEDMDTTK